MAVQIAFLDTTFNAFNKLSQGKTDLLWHPSEGFKNLLLCVEGLWSPYATTPIVGRPCPKGAGNGRQKCHFRAFLEACKKFCSANIDPFSFSVGHTMPKLDF